MDNIQYTIKHKLRILGQEQNISFNNSNEKNKVVVETEICIKNKWIVRMLSEKIASETNRLFTSDDILLIDYIETNSKLVKKLKLPYRKSKLKNTKIKDFEHIKEYNRYGTQLILGNKEIIRIIKSLVLFWKNENDFEPKFIKGTRLTGSAGNNNTIKNVNIPVFNLKHN